MATQAQLKAQARYDKTNTWTFPTKLNFNTDAEIITWLKAQGNRQGYIKHLIREDIRQTDAAMLDRLHQLVDDGKASAWFQRDPYDDFGELFVRTDDADVSRWVEVRFGAHVQDVLGGDPCYVIPCGNGEFYQESIWPAVEGWMA